MTPQIDYERHAIVAVLERLPLAQVGPRRLAREHPAIREERGSIGLLRQAEALQADLFQQFHDPGEVELVLVDVEQQIAAFACYRRRKSARIWRQETL